MFYISHMNKKIVSIVFGVALVLTVPASSFAASCPDYTGKIISTKSDLWLVHEGKRWPLFDREVATTWGKSVYSANVACAEAIPLSNGKMGYRAGTRLLKQPDSATIYAIGRSGAIHLIDSPEVAAQWFGPQWGKLVRTVPATILSSYKIGQPMTAETLPDGFVVRTAAKQVWYVVKEGKLVRITGLVPPAIYNNTRVLSPTLFAKFAVDSHTVPVTELVTVKTDR